VTLLFVELVCDAGMITPEECKMFFESMGSGPGGPGGSSSSESGHHDHSESSESGPPPAGGSDDSEAGFGGFTLDMCLAFEGFDQNVCAWLAAVE
jgi:hypothetical protein